MWEIQPTAEFLATLVLAAHEVYRYVDTGCEDHTSRECVGRIWGHREAGGVFRAELAPVVQLVESSHEDGAVCQSSFHHLLHSAWVGSFSLTYCYLGTFHSHPWPPDNEWLPSPKWLWNQSHEASATDLDDENMPRDTIQMIVSVRAQDLTRSPVDRWVADGPLLRRRVDIVDVTVAGYYKDEEGNVHTCPVRAPA